MIRKTRITALITALVMALSLMPQLMVTAAGRNITISNETELIRFCDEVSQGKSNVLDSITLTADIVVHSDWRPIGTAYVPFYGTFNGNGHKITCLSINRDYTAFSGIFGHIASSAEIKNLTVQIAVSGDFYFGGVVGYNNGGTVTNCCNTGSISGSRDVGGVVGYNNGGTVTNCYNTGTVSGSSDVSGVGGVVGYNNGGAVTNCYNTGAVSGDCYEGGVGGIVGYNSGTVTNCYNTGYVWESRNFGAIVGYNDGGTATNSYYLSTCGAAGEGLSKTTAQFASGAVTHLLQNGQSSQIWGQ